MESKIDWSKAQDLVVLRDSGKSCVRIREVQGFVDIRTFVATRRYTGPTQNGFLFDKASAADLWEALGEFLRR